MWSEWQERVHQSASLGTRPGRRKGIAFSPQATPKSRCLNFADNQRGSQKSMDVVSTQTGQSSLTASCTKSPPPLQKTLLFITRQDFSIDSSGKRSSPSLPQCGYNSRAAPCCSWRFAVLTQKHRWTRESVSEKAKSEKYLSAGHHG